MLSVSSIFHEIKNNDEAFAFFISVAAKGETQGGWENERIAALTKDPVLRGKIARHGEDEERHGKLFGALLRRRGLEPKEVPATADYCMMLEGRGIGLSHERLKRDEALTDQEILEYLAHSRVTEQRASEEVDQMVDVFRKDPEIGPAVRMIADDEVNHLSYCHEELLRLASESEAKRREIETMLRRYARAEIETYRRVGLDFVERMGTILNWSGAKKRLLRFGVQAKYQSEKMFGWRRMVRLAEPARPNAMAPKEATAS